MGEMGSPIRVFLADLNHSGHNAKTFPYAAGCVGSYALQHLGSRLSVEMFKEPTALGEAFLQERPTLVGFSNYIWNASLSYEFVRRMKQAEPRTVVVFGGPNYPEAPEEQAAHLARHPLVDFFVYHEGEAAFLELLLALERFDFDVAALKAQETRIPGCHYLRDGVLVAGDAPPKILDLDEIASPYLSGLFDKFFIEGLAPLMQFTRGCPFSCTFCTEGKGYYSKLGRASTDRFAQELEYAAARVTDSPPLYLADANFGMYREDLEVCARIGEIRDRTGWPGVIITATGKNQKERVIEASHLVRGAFRVAAAIQSTNGTVLRNIKRTNISTDKLVEAAHLNNDLDQDSFAEIILNLPGDTVQAHRESIRAVVDAGITRIQIYPLLFLPGTELASEETRRRFGFETRFRILPRCFGHYRFAGEELPSAEVVELPVASNTMTADDYLDCKEFDLSVEIFYNDHALREVSGFLSHLGLSMFQFVATCHDLRSEFPQRLGVLYDEFRQMSSRELWEEKDALEAWLRQGDNLAQYGRVEYRNSLATNRAIALLTCVPEVMDVARRGLRKLLEESGRGTPGMLRFADELIEFCLLRRDALLEGHDRVGSFSFDFLRMAEQGFAVDPNDFTLTSSQELEFFQVPEILEEMRRHHAAYPEPFNALRNVLYHSLHVRVQNYYRRFRATADSGSARQHVGA